MARPLVRASSNAATTGPDAGHAQVRSSSLSRVAEGGGVAAPVSGTALTAGGVGTAVAAPLALGSGLLGSGGRGLNVAPGAAEVVVVVVVVTVDPGATSPDGGTTR